MNTGEEADRDGDSTNDEEYVVRERIDTEGRKNMSSKKRHQKPCRTRFDVLATPNRRLILALYQDHAYHFPREKVEKIKEILQELYAMTPEETERYFMEIRQEASKIARKRRIKEIMRKQYKRQKRAAQVERAFQFIESIMKRGMASAFNNLVPPLVTVRLRNLSDIILEQICDLRNVDHPDREDPTQEGLFLIAVSDWLGIVMEHIYYAVQLKKNEELEKIEKERAELDKSRVKKSESPASSKTEDTGTDVDKAKQKQDKETDDEEVELLQQQE